MAINSTKASRNSYFSSSVPRSLTWYSPLAQKIHRLVYLKEMFNGIGLPTPRGSGTSGYIQANKAFLKPKRSDFPSTASAFAGKDFRALESRAPKIKKANPELLEHEKRRKVEVQLVILEDDLKSRGLGEEEVEEMIKLERQRLLDDMLVREEEVGARNKEDRDTIAG